MTAGSMIPTASATTSSVAAASVLAEHAPAAVDLLRQGLHQAMHCASSFVCGAVPFLSTAAWKRPERGKQKKRKGGQRQYYDEDEGPLWRDVIAE